MNAIHLAGSRKKFVRRLALGVLWAGTILALVLAVERWRGHRAWKAVERDLIARGEDLNWDHYVPKPVPAEENFGDTEIVRQWFIPEVQGAAPPSRFGRAKGNLPGRSREMPWRPIDLSAWARAFMTTNDLDATILSNPPLPRVEAARAVLAALEPERSELEAVRAGLDRRYSQYPVNFSGDDVFQVLLPHLRNLREMAEKLQLRAVASLAAGESGDALEDLRTIINLAESLDGEPTLVSQLVRLAVWRLGVTTAWEGLHARAWSVPQTRELQALFAGRSFPNILERALDAERAGALRLISGMVRGSSFPQFLFRSPGNTSLLNNTSIRLMPSGWFYHEQAHYAQAMEGLLAGGIDVAGQRVYPGVLRSNAERFTAASSSPVRMFLEHRILTAMLVPALEAASRRFMESQAQADMAAIASALEGFRLEHGSYPPSLAELSPAGTPPLPLDWITGKPFLYRADGDTYRLYSPGWNEQDEGGAPPAKDGSGAETGDWVWGMNFRPQGRPATASSGS